MAISAFVSIICTAIIFRTFEPKQQIKTVIKAVPATLTEVPHDRAPLGTAILYGRITDVTTGQFGTTVTFQLVEWVLGKDNQEQAAIEDGTCTLERVEQDHCSPAGFYMRSTTKQLTLPVIDEPLISIMARDGALGFSVNEDGKIFQKTVDMNGLKKTLQENDFSITPFIITTSEGSIISMQEQYLP